MLGLQMLGGIRSVHSNSAHLGVQFKRSYLCFTPVRCSREAVTDDDLVLAKQAAEEMVSVQFRGNEFTALKGTTLRTALLQNGLSPHSATAVTINCRGAGTCGTCAVQIGGNVIPSKWGLKESFRLSLPPHRSPQNSKLRLACSVRLNGELKVVKYNKFWGQGDVPLGPTVATDSVTPLGDLEFVLDMNRGKSPK